MMMKKPILLLLLLCSAQMIVHAQRIFNPCDYAKGKNIDAAFLKKYPRAIYASFADKTGSQYDCSGVLIDTLICRIVRDKRYEYFEVIDVYSKHANEGESEAYCTYATELFYHCFDPFVKYLYKTRMLSIPFSEVLQMGWGYGDTYTIAGLPEIPDMPMGAMPDKNAVTKFINNRLKKTTLTVEEQNFIRKLIKEAKYFDL